MARVNDLIVPRRHCGPPDSGNGGWTAGALAALLPHHPANRCEAWPTIEVTLRQPPPLDSPMTVTTDDHGCQASFGGTLIAGARVVGVPSESAQEALVEVDPVDAETARAAEADYPGLAFHPFPTCFVCGTGREPGDGLRIFPGPVGEGRAAATWTPHPSVAEDYHQYADDHPRASLATTWAALDCTGAWAADFGERLMVLGRMSARVDTLPVIGEEHVVVGEARGQEGRKSMTATTLYDSDGRIVATAEHVWVAVDPARFGGVVPA